MAPTAPPGQPVTIVQLADRPTPEISVADILLGSVGLVLLFLLAAALVGLVVGGAFILIKRRFPSNAFNGQDAADTALRLNS